MRRSLFLIGSAVFLFGFCAFPLFGKSEIKLDNGKTVSIRTSRLQMSFEAGFVTGLTDLKTGESFINKPADAAMPNNESRNSLMPKDAAPAIQKTSGNEATVTYALPNNVTLLYDFKIDGDDIMIRQRVKNYDMMSKKNTLNLDIHVPFMTPDAVIMGMGNRVTRNEPKYREQLLWPGSGYFFPRVSVAEGKKSTLLFFCESAMPYHNFIVSHTPESDYFILRSGAQDLMKKTGRPLQFKNGDMDCFYWRISAHENWVEAAKSWRKHFEQYTEAVPLWKNTSSTVRNTHAFFTGSYSADWKENADVYYKTLSSKFNPKHLLLFYWNSSSDVMLIDPTRSTRYTPSNDALKALRKYGFRWMEFHGLTLFYASEKKMNDHLEMMKSRKLVPEGYKFTPVWQGKPEDFLPTMKKYGFGVEKREWALLNPAAKEVRDFACVNIPRYVKEHQVDGFYLDVTAAVHYGIYDQFLVMEGNTFYDGDVLIFSRLHKENPELCFMTEYAGEWVIPYAFWHWEGTYTFDDHRVRINHPFRAALYGSYAWARENTAQMDPVKSTLFGTLPEVIWGPGSAHLEDELTDPWYNERAKMFIDNKLFYDLPEKWEKGALAYLRTDGTNKWTVFREEPYGYAFEQNGKVLLGIYRKTAKGIPGYAIPNWCAYDESGAAIGLDPAKEYRFISQSVADKVPLNISRLTDGVSLSSVRHSEYATTVLFESAKEKSAAASVAFAQAPLRVYVNGEEQKSGETAFNIPLPGSLTVVWKESKKPADLVNPPNDINKYSALRSLFRSCAYDVNGLRGSVGFRGWAGNFSSYLEKAKADNIEKVALRVGAARFFSTAECITQIPADKTTLTFSFFMPSTTKNIQMEARIRVNGLLVWKEDIPCTKSWTPRSVDLSKFAGKTVLLTFEYGHKNADRSDRVARAGNNNIEFGDIRLISPADEIKK